MNREQLLRRVDGEWRRFMEACERLSTEVCQQPGVVEQWSVKDLISHVATWEQESVAALSTISEGRRVPLYATYGGIDAFNDRKWRQYRELSCEEATARASDAHRRLMAFLAEIPECHFAGEGRFRRRLRQDTYGHNPEHFQQVATWRETNPKPDIGQ